MLSATEIQSRIRQNHLNRVVVPLIADGQLESGVEGSGCFFESDNLLFFVTAAHVAQAIQAAPERVGVPERPGGGACYTLGKGRMAFTDPEREDVAVFRIDEDTVVQRIQQSGYRILTQKDVAVTMPSNRMGLCYGWPNSCAVTHNGTVSGSPVGMLVPIIGKDNLYLTLRWPEADDVPVLKGISGSPIWAVQECENTWSPDEEIRLLGVEHTIKKGEYVRGTLWSVVSQAMATLL